jgi:hypothetical protein
VDGIAADALVAKSAMARGISFRKVRDELTA